MQQGLITKSTGSWYEVLLENGKTIHARILGKFKMKGWKLTNPVAVGDLVKIREDKHSGDMLIAKILPRSNYVVRQSPRKKHNLHLLAANVDQAMLVITITSPNLKQGFIDRFMLMTEPHDIPLILIINKLDIYDENDLAILHGVKNLYENIGVKVMAVSATEGTGIEEIKNELRDKRTLIGGQSGVGKSSLLNTIQNKLNLKTTIVSDYSGKGQHTTTFAQLYQIKDINAQVIDTPGIKTLSFNNLEVLDVAHNFREFFENSSSCKFSNCTHRDEPKCAIKTAIENDEISILRYQNYLSILDEIENQNYWERHTDM